MIRAMIEEFKCPIGMYKGLQGLSGGGFPEEQWGHLISKMKSWMKSILRNSNLILPFPNYMQTVADLKISEDLLYFILSTVSVNLSYQLPDVLD